MQDPTPLKEAGGDSILVEKVKEYIELQFKTAEGLMGGEEVLFDLAQQSNIKLQEIALLIGVDYLNTINERVVATILGE